MPDTPIAASSGGAAPVTAAPSSSPAPASATATPASSVSHTPTPAAAQPVAATPAPAGGEPPQERWPDILDNARKKTRAEVEQEYRQKYGHYDIFERDPWGAIQQWLGEASQHSMYGPMVQQWAQQYMQSQAAPERGAEPEADVPIVDQQGNVTGHTFSDKRLREWHKWNQTAQQQALDQRFGALERSTQAREQRDQQQQAWYQATQQAGQTLNTLRALPYFKDHEPAIRQALEEHEEWGDNIHAAYNHVLVSQILPTLGQAEQQKVITSLQNKASGASISPSGAAPGAPQFRNFREAAEYFAAHPDEAKVMAERQG